MKKFILLLFLFISTLTYSQKENTLIQNVNSSAKELAHKLNEDRSRVLLECDSCTIYRVSVYEQGDNLTDQYKEHYYPNAKEASIPVEGLPNGRFTIAVHIKFKIIAITLIVRESSLAKTVPVVRKDTVKIKTDLPQLTHTQLLSKKLPSYTVKKDLPQEKKPDTIENYVSLVSKDSLSKDSPVKAYWVYEYTKSTFGTHIAERMVDKKTADYLIAKNKYDLTTHTGKDNKLIVWEVYDLRKFIDEKKVVDEVVYYPKGSFNEQPIYITQ